MVSRSVSEYPVYRYDQQYCSRPQRVPYSTCWIALLITASLLNARATMTDAVSGPSTTMQLFQTVDVNSDRASSPASLGDTEHQDALKVIFAGSDPMSLRWDDPDMVRQSDSMNQERDVPNTGNVMSAERLRRSANNALMDDGEDVLPLRVARRGRWSTYQMWRTRPSILVDDDSRDDNEDTQMEKPVNELLEGAAEDDAGQRHTSLDERKRSLSRELGSRATMIPYHAAKMRRLQTSRHQHGVSGLPDVTRHGLMRSALLNRLISKNRERIDSTKKNWDTTVLRDGGRSDQRVLAVEDEQSNSDNKVVVVRQKLEKRTTSGNPSLGELSLKRIVGKEPGSWNGNQKGWASNNVRIWG